MHTLTPPCSGLDILPKFAGFLKATPEEAAAKEAELLAALRALDAFLQAHGGGPYIGGAAPCATDCSVMPRLYHMQVATKHFRVSMAGGAAAWTVHCGGRVLLVSCLSARMLNARHVGCWVLGRLSSRRCCRAGRCPRSWRLCGATWTPSWHDPAGSTPCMRPSWWCAAGRGMASSPLLGGARRRRGSDESLTLLI